MNAMNLLASAKNDMFGTDDVQTASDYLEQNISLGSLKVSYEGSAKSLKLRNVNKAFASISLRCWAWSSGVSLSSPELLDRYLMSFVLQGNCTVRQGTQEFAAIPGSIFFVSPNEPTKFCFNSDCRRLTVDIPQSVMARTFFDEFGYMPADSIEFQLSEQKSGNRHLALTGLINAVCADLSRTQPGFSCERVQRRVQEALLVTMLDTIPHKYTNALDDNNSGAVPHHVRRAEEFIAANLTEPITMADLAEATGVTGRTILNGFKRFRETTPFTHIKNERLKIAREKLLANNENDTNVTNVALDVGFPHFGRFAGEYKNLFGESPSETLCRR